MLRVVLPDDARQGRLVLGALRVEAHGVLQPLVAVMEVEEAA